MTVSVALVKLMYVDNFYNDIHDIAGAVYGLNYVPKKFGHEVDDFNMIDPSLINRFRYMCQDDKLVIDEKNSGVFRKPMINIHYEDFKTAFDWCFTIALVETQFQLYKHTNGTEDALANPTLNSYNNNILEWDCITSVTLKPNQCVFFRPWLYHSFLGGLTQHYIMNHDISLYTPEEKARIGLT